MQYQTLSHMVTHAILERQYHGLTSFMSCVCVQPEPLLVSRVLTRYLDLESLSTCWIVLVDDLVTEQLRKIHSEFALDVWTRFTDVKIFRVIVQLEPDVHLQSLSRITRVQDRGWSIPTNSLSWKFKVTTRSILVTEFIITWRTNSSFSSVGVRHVNTEFRRKVDYRQCTYHFIVGFDGTNLFIKAQIFHISGSEGAVQSVYPLIWLSISIEIPQTNAFNIESFYNVLSSHSPILLN